MLSFFGFNESLSALFLLECLQMFMLITFFRCVL